MNLCMPVNMDLENPLWDGYYTVVIITALGVCLEVAGSLTHTQASWFGHSPVNGLCDPSVNCLSPRPS